MSYMLKSQARGVKWGMISGTGDNVFSIGTADFRVQKFPLQNNFYSNSGLLCTISESRITLASKRYMFFVKPFYDQLGNFSYLYICALEFFLYVNGQPIQISPIIASPSPAWAYAQTAIAVGEYVANSGDVLELCYQKKVDSAGPSELGIYWHNGSLGTNMFGFYIMEIDL